MKPIESTPNAVKLALLGTMGGTHIGGSFARGLEVSVDGHKLATLKNQLAEDNAAFFPVGTIFLSLGAHKITYTYPGSSLAPGSAENELTELTGTVLQPEYPKAELVSVAPGEYGKLCGRDLNWVEIVKNA